MSEIEYYDLIFEISTKIDVDQLERLVFMCTKKISKASKGMIQNALGLFEELEKQGYLGIDKLETLKEILKQLKKRSMLKKVEEFEIKRKAQSVGIIALFKQATVNLKGAIKMVCNFRTIGGALLVVSSGMALRSCSTLDEFVETFNKVVLVAYTKLVEISEGSLCFTVQAETPAALKELWNTYKDGTLQRRLQKFLVTDDIKQLTDAKDIELAVFIDEQEYVMSFNFLQNQAVPDMKVERFRRKSDSFFHINSNQREIAMMKLTQAENQLSFERQVHGEEIKKLKERIILAREPREDEILERPRERRRRNSDSNLYYKAREEEVEQTDNQPERALEGGVQLDIEKRLFVENYLQNIHETHSTTTETSDSGIRTLGTTAEIEMQDIPGDDHKLCCKDLGGEVIKKLERRLKNDETALKQICQSFGIDRSPLFSWESPFSGILSMFPDTPVKLLKEVFEALQLYDLIDLLEEGKSRATRSLRPALRLQEIEKLRNPDDRPISYHSSVAVLIINYEKNSDTEGIEKFFKGLNNKSEVTVMHYRNFNEAVKIYPWSLRDEENITREINKLRLTSSEVIRSWISNQDKYSLVAVFFVSDGPYSWSYRAGNSFLESVKERLVTAFPTKVKLIIHSSFRQPHSWLHEELVEVSVPFDGDVFLPLMLEIFIKRWQTMDLMSMMRELKRSLREKSTVRGFRVLRDFGEFIIKDNLSCLVRFIMHEEPTN